MQELRDALCETFPAMLIAAFGGLVNYMGTPKRTWSFSSCLTGIITAAFVGMLLSLVLDSVDIPPAMKAAIIAMGGHCSKDILVILQKKLMPWLAFLEGNGGDNGNE